MDEEHERREAREARRAEHRQVVEELRLGWEQAEPIKAKLAVEPIKDGLDEAMASVIEPGNLFEDVPDDIDEDVSRIEERDVDYTWGKSVDTQARADEKATQGDYSAWGSYYWIGKDGLWDKWQNLAVARSLVEAFRQSKHRDDNLPLFSYLERLDARNLERSNLWLTIAVWLRKGNLINKISPNQAPDNGAWIDSLDLNGKWINHYYPMLGIRPAKRERIVPEMFVSRNDGLLMTKRIEVIKGIPRIESIKGIHLGLSEFDSKEFGPDLPLAVGTLVQELPCAPSKLVPKKDDGKGNYLCEWIYSRVVAKHKASEVRRHYARHCVICDHASSWKPEDGPPPPLSVFNPEEFTPEGKKIKKGSVSLGDHPTGQFVCQYCERQAKKQNERLEIPEVEKEITSRDRLRGKSKPLSELRQVLKEDFPVLFSELSESEEYREGTHSLGDGNFWRKGGPDAVSD